MCFSHWIASDQPLVLFTGDNGLGRFEGQLCQRYVQQLKKTSLTMGGTSTVV